MQQSLVEILQKGRLYYPAYTHYGGTDAITVNCDRCFKHGLDICVGYMTQDLCLPCAEAVATISGARAPRACAFGSAPAPDGRVVMAQGFAPPARIAKGAAADDDDPGSQLL